MFPSIRSWRSPAPPSPKSAIFNSTNDHQGPSRRTRHDHGGTVGLDVNGIQQELEKFAKERDWNQYHSPKNLAMALSVEAAELLEHFQWLTQEQSAGLDAKTLEDVAAEIADIQIYLLRLADKLHINLESAVHEKIAENRRKYPTEKVKGSAAKYTAYE